MLEVGKKRAKERNFEGPCTKLLDIEWIEGNAESLQIEDSSQDIYTISFGMRNIANRLNAIKECYRVLKPGGRFFCLEMSKVQNPLFRSFYNFYTFNISPLMTKIIAKENDIYNYLAESICMFDDQETLKEKYESVGFRNVQYINLSNGIVAIHKGIK